MAQAKVKFASFEEYLVWSNASENYIEGQYELVDGELVKVPPEAGLNSTIANRLLFLLIFTGTVALELVYPGQCEVQVPVLRPKDPANRYPDLVILEEVHLALTQKRLTITFDMPPPRLVAEVMSPGKQNRERDLTRKRDQYAARSIPEYWLIDPQLQIITVLQLWDGRYVEVGAFQDRDRLVSPIFPTLQLATEQVFGA